MRRGEVRAWIGNEKMTVSITTDTLRTCLRSKRRINMNGFVIDMYRASITSGDEAFCAPSVGALGALA